ncbi:hypothetical protein GCM10010363_19180 [Streptomyces omiyaensis]|nr:hypothetical protein GCM10010363_19180 [Streptomyces omiyaensis]
MQTPGRRDVERPLRAVRATADCSTTVRSLPGEPRLQLRAGGDSVSGAEMDWLVAIDIFREGSVA